MARAAQGLGLNRSRLLNGAEMYGYLNNSHEVLLKRPFLFRGKAESARFSQGLLTLSVQDNKKLDNRKRYPERKETFPHLEKIQAAAGPQDCGKLSVPDCWYIAFKPPLKI